MRIACVGIARLSQSSSSSPRSASAEHVERRERLVETQQLGLHRERAGEADLLAHAARELAGIGALEAGEADELDQALGVIAPFGRRDPARLERDLHVLDHREPGKEREGLEHDGRVRIDAGERRAAIEHPPARGAMSPATMRSRVDLPQPEGPTRHTNSPGATAKLTSRSA